MLPQIVLHRPRGVVPKVSLHRRTVLDYQPSWLLVALPVLSAALLRSKRSGSSDGERSGSSDGPAREGTTSQGTDLSDRARTGQPRRRPRVIIVSAVRARRSGGRPTATPVPE